MLEPGPWKIVIVSYFLEFYFEPFSHKYPEEKLMDILQKNMAVKCPA